jgi:ABC-2 type transport system ATP-binding protein
MELSIECLSKRFGSKIAVNNISVTLQPGVYGLLGANGAGKTTLMRMVCDVLKPTSGRILYNGKEIEQLGENYRSYLGYLPQDFGYYPDFTAKEYLDFIVAIKGIDTVTAKKKIAELLEIVNLSDVAGKKIRTFSGGMKQRLGIAQAVINDPHILVLDEPTAGLDPKERMRFRNLIAELAKDKIVILSTHIVSDIDYIADDILMMKKGSLILNCSTEDAIHSMNGKVWNCKLHQSQIDEISERLRVVNLHHEQGNEVLLRIVSDTQPTRGAVNVPPTLDDLYLYHFQDEEIRRDEK